MADNTKFVSLPPKQLTEPLSTSATTLYANNLNFDLDGTRALALTDLGDYGWIVLEPRSVQNREICKVTGISGTQLTIARGYKPFAPYDQDTATWAKTHSVGVSFVFTNAPQMYNEFTVKDNDETITGTWTFTEATRPLLTADVDTATNEDLITYGQLYRTAIAGAVNATDTQKGIVEITTSAQVASGASVGETGASVVPTPAQIAAQIQSGAWTFATTGGTASAITATFTPAITALAHGMILCIHNTTANNAGATFNPNSLGARAIYKYAGGSAVAVEANDMKALYHYILLYDSDADVFLLINPSNGTLTASTTTAATSFFSTTLAQPTRSTLTYGHALNAGELVSIESDGKVYRTRPKAFTTTNASTTTSTAEELGTSGKALILETPTSTKKIWIGRDAQATAFIDMYLVTISALYESASVALTSLSSAAGVFYDAIMDSDTLIAAYRLDTGTTRLIAVTDADGTPSAGAELNMATGDGGAICATTTASTYIGFSNASSNLTGYKITRSGNTLTNAASATLVAGSKTPVAARNFEGTNFILVVYVDGTDFKAIVGEYNPTAGTWTSIGAAVTISDSAISEVNPVFIEMLSSTQALVTFQGATNMQGLVLTRSATTLSSGALSSLITSVTSSGGHCSMNKATDRHYFLSAETTSGGKAQIIELDRDYATVSTLGSASTYGNAANEGVAIGLVTPTRTLAVYQDGSDSFFSVADLTTNLDGTVGFADATGATDSTNSVITSGHVTGLSGLTAGTTYNKGLNGELTTSALGTLPTSATTLSPVPKVKPILNAISTTAGIKI